MVRAPLTLLLLDMAVEAEERLKMFLDVVGAEVGVGGQEGMVRWILVDYWQPYPVDRLTS
jgi:hypothetical protein